MGMREREGLITRVKQMRRVAAADDSRTTSEPCPSDVAAIQALETRVGHLEELLEGFQDSVHRESLRQERRVSELEARLEPSMLAAALSKDARERGL